MYTQLHFLMPRTMTSDLGDGSAERTKVTGRVHVYGLLAGVRF